jgi:hypothetical protein
VIADFVRQLRVLPYADMMVVARALTQTLSDQQKASGTKVIDPMHVAEALLQLSKMKIEDSPNTTQEHKIAQDIFTRRRSISIKAVNGGFQFDLSTCNASVMNKDLKTGLGQLIDTIVTAQALRG